MRTRILTALDPGTLRVGIDMRTLAAIQSTSPTPVATSESASHLLTTERVGRSRMILMKVLLAPAPALARIGPAPRPLAGAAAARVEAGANRPPRR